MDDIPTLREVRDHFGVGEDANAIVINCGKRQTAAWVRERWHDHLLGAKAVVWNDCVAITATDEVHERILSEAPDHWIETADKAETTDDTNQGLDHE